MAKKSTMSVANFKNAQGIGKFKVVRNPNSDKLFVAADNGLNYRCQQDLDITKPCEWLIVDDEGVVSYCFINVGSGDNAIAEF